MKTEQKRKCIGLCKEYLAKKPRGVGRYASGQFRCQICEVYISIEGTKKNEGVYCKCCNYRVRGKPRNKIYKDKLRNSVNSQSLEIKICPHCGKIGKGEKNIEELFGFRKMSHKTTLSQSYCRECRGHHQIKDSVITSGLQPDTEDQVQLSSLDSLMNLKNPDSNIRELINIFTSFYKKYGSIRSVSEISKYSSNVIRKYVKFERLPKIVQDAYDVKKFDFNLALRATDTLEWDGDSNDGKKVLELTLEMSKLDTLEKNYAERILKSDPSLSVARTIHMVKRDLNGKTKNRTNSNS